MSVSQTWRPLPISVIQGSKNMKYNRNKIRKIQEKCLLAVFNDYLNSYSELIQSSTRSASVQTQWLCYIGYNVFETSSDLNPNFMK